MTRSKRIYPPPIRVMRICVYARVYVFVCVCFVEKKEKAVNNIPPIGRRWGRVAKKSYLQKLYTAIRETEKRFACRDYFFFFPFFFLIEASRDRFPIVDERRIVFSRVRTQLPSKRRKIRTRKCKYTQMTLRVEI